MLVYEDFVGLAVVDEVYGGEVGGGLGGAFVFDYIHGGAVAVADGELLPFGGDAGVEGELGALLADAKDVLDAGFVGPGG